MVHISFISLGKLTTVCTTKAEGKRFLCILIFDCLRSNQCTRLFVIILLNALNVQYLDFFPCVLFDILFICLTGSDYAKKSPMLSKVGILGYFFP